MMPKNLAPESSVLTTTLYLPISDEGVRVLWGPLQQPLSQGLNNNAKSPASYLF